MYTFDGRIRYSEVDAGRKLTAEKTIDYFQDCSSFQSEDLGVGLDYMSENHFAWVINYWQICFERRPVMGEAVRTGTQPYEFKGILGMRNFMMETLDGERLATANSVWSLLDMDKMYPMRIPAELIEKYKTEPRLEMDYKPRKIAVPKEGGEELETIVVRRHHLDTNQHMNNAQYVHFAVMYLPAGTEIRELRVEYKKQAMLGDHIKPVIYHISDDMILVSMNGEDGKPYAAVEMKLLKEGTL
ncbi:MAG: acyl-[Lachnospiraceae bacterium]|nr:acyl-[acyl-carrier-protein] thioesterase [Lachnospiraceae bacterium]